MFELFERVRIISNNLIGTIVDIYEANGTTKYIVESDEEYPECADDDDRFPLFYCTEKDIEKVE